MSCDTVEFRILGPFEVTEQGNAVPLGGRKQSALLALLLLHREEVVSTDRLINGLWGDSPTATAAKSLQVYVSQLRKVLGEGVIETRGRGYALHVGPGMADVERFEHFLDEGRRLLAAGQARQAAETLRNALGLWRGPPLADFTFEPFAQTEMARLEELRLAALEERIEADLANGRHADVVPELRSLVGDHPLRERLRAQHMLALYRTGRQADALHAYRDARSALDEELGVEPGRDLQDLERAILEHDPRLDAPPRAVVAAIKARRGALFIAIGGALLLVAAIAAGIVTLATRETPFVPEPNTVAQIDPDSGNVTGGARVGTTPAVIAAGDGSLWIANFDDKTLQRVDSATGMADPAQGGLPGSPTGIAAGGGFVWVTSSFSGEVVKLDRRTLSSGRPIEVGTGVRGIAYGAGGVWVADSQHDRVLRIDPETDQIEAIPLESGSRPIGVAVGAGLVWVTESLGGQVVRIDPATNAVVGATRLLAGQPEDIAFGAGYVWATVPGDDSVLRIDPATGSGTTISDVGNEPSGVAAGAEGVWVANALDGTIVGIDPRLATVGREIRLATGLSPTGVALAAGALWVTIARAI